MQIPTHILSGWCVGNCVPINARQRAACMVAASIADLDGITLVGGFALYQRTHHVLGHNFEWAIVSSLLLVWWTGGRWPIFLLYLACFHLHLWLDYYGSGFGWPIYYFWPFSNAAYRSPHGWALGAWQNYAAMGFFFLWTLGIAAWIRRTPFECVVPKWDRRWFGKGRTVDR